MVVKVLFDYDVYIDIVLLNGMMLLMMVVCGNYVLMVMLLFD